MATLTLLEQRFGSIEGILRIRRALSSLPPPVAEALVQLAERGASADDGWNAVRRGVMAAEVLRRIRAAPLLQDTDGDRLQAAHQRYRALEDRKRALVRDAVAHVWVQKQRQRLLASTGSRLNGAGRRAAARRFVSRGERAMRLRQVIKTPVQTSRAATRSSTCGRCGWPARPRWPSFFRAPLFDVVIFDEASQCRLEEALPVLLRGQRVVIAGDPKQLPPTRFFEAGVVASEDDEPQTDQELFEVQQAQADDLLTAALNLAVEHAAIWTCITARTMPT